MYQNCFVRLQRFTKRYSITLLVLVVLFGFIQIKKKRPTLYLIGDSTVADGSGKDSLWGWGKFLVNYLDTNKIEIQNFAQGGTSTRTYYTGGFWNPKLLTHGLWEEVSLKLKKGDYLIIQFGLNDQSPIDDSTRSRGVLPGIGNDSVVIYNKVLHKTETVYSFGWYLRQFISFAKARGVTVMVASSIPVNAWKDGKVVRGEKGFANWALQVAKNEAVTAIDLNNLIADQYEKDGQAITSTKYHLAKDKTHTTAEGAQLNACIVASTIKNANLKPLSKWILK